MEGEHGILRQFRLDGTTALVTGAKRGIGKAMAVALAEAGSDILAVSASLELQGSDVEREVTARGRSFRAYACDFSNRAAVSAFAKQVREENPPIDILVNNAGTIRRQPAAEHSEAYWNEVMEVNLHAPFVLSQVIGRDMVERGRGKIIFVASLLSFQGGIQVPGYAASKGGIAQLMKALANEWAPFGVQVNAIAPGYIETDNTEALRHHPDRNRAITERIPAGRWGQPADIQGATVFLASSASDYVTGHVLAVDGGWLAR